MDISELSADPELAQKGKWFKFEDDVEFLIAFNENKTYRRKQQKAMMKARLSRGGHNIPEITDEMNIESAFGTVLLGWKGLTQNGQPFEFNLKNAKLLLTQPNGALSFILTEAGIKSNFQEDEDEDEDETPQPKKEELPADKAELKSGDGVGVGVGTTP
jgi:hypothetical protein